MSREEFIDKLYYVLIGDRNAFNDIVCAYDSVLSANEKADNQLKIIMQILKEQPNRCIEDDEWLENRLIAVANILQNGSDSQ